jgi:hypothetical protein
MRALASAVARSADKAMNYYRMAAVSAILGFLVQGMTDYSFYNYRVALVFWAVLGLSMALSRRENDMALSRRDKDIKPLHRGIERQAPEETEAEGG